MVALARTLGSEIIAEGVETPEEYSALRHCGVRLMQGYLLARPAFEALPAFTLPTFDRELPHAPAPPRPPVLTAAILNNL
jgi:EAL domain-containing protein (putative c-di-GMP-specific phosphodiesterase class I)